MTQDKLESLCVGRKIARVLFLVFQPTGHELQMTDMESLHLVSKSFETVTWGIGSCHEDSVRLVTLVEVVSQCGGYSYLRTCFERVHQESYRYC